MIENPRAGPNYRDFLVRPSEVEKLKEDQAKQDFEYIRSPEPVVDALTGRRWPSGGNRSLNKLILGKRAMLFGTSYSLELDI